jgi:4-amino-4-deoxy-L-arabinose transferase-like glycosyltransferase
MEISSRRATRSIILAGIIAIAAALRLYGLSWGLPDVYEEAIPLKQAWGMWGWGPSGSVDLNPHFFNYPSLTIYCQLLGQGVLYLGMRLSGAVRSGADYAALYLTDKTPFLLTGRVITTLFSVATVWLLYRVCRKTASVFASLSAAFFLAISTFHIEKSQVVEVDVPLAFLCTLSLLLILRISEKPSRLNYLLAGSAIGVAVSAKYPALLLLIPLIAAHLSAARAPGPAPRPGKSKKGKAGDWRFLAGALGLAAAAFLITSPFVLLDLSSALKDLSVERLHMREGHFGLEASSTWLFYIRALGERILGWPLAALAASGLVYRLFRRRDRASLVLASFVIPYAIAIASWAMKADRYLLPLVPAALVLAASAMDDVLRVPQIAANSILRTGAAAALFVASAAPLVLAYPAHLREYAPDTRTLAREWIEAHIPSGAFIVAESYGPELLSPHALLSVGREIRTEALERLADRPQYAVQPIPMLQVYPERSAAFYDLNLYLDTDLFITTSAVRARYLAEPARFPRQAAFYDSLEAGFLKLREFVPSGGPGPAIALYERRGFSVPFAGRSAVFGPRPLRTTTLSGVEALFYKNLGVNYEAFGFHEQAIACYDFAFGYEMARPAWYVDVVLGKLRCLRALGRGAEASSFLRAAAQRAPSAELRDRIIRLSRSIESPR